jgi:hypothetical protein
LKLDPEQPENPELPLDELGFALEMHERATGLVQAVIDRKRVLDKVEAQVEIQAARLADIQASTRELAFRFETIHEAELFRVSRHSAWQRIQAAGHWGELPAYCWLVIRGKMALACLRSHRSLRQCYATPKAKAAHC